MRITLIGALLASAILAACSNQQIYAGLQANQRNRCLEYPDDQRERCLAAADASYDDYARQRSTE